MSSNSGLTAYLRVAGGQYEPGELGTEPGASEPTVDTIKSNNTHISPGASGRSITGSVNGAARAVLIGLAGDSAHWLIPVGVPDLDKIGNFTFSASMSFSPNMPAGDRSLVFRAVDGAGALGPPQSLALKSFAADVPVGALVIQLSWDTDADLDLHVRITDPTVPKTGYFDVWNRAPLALPPGPSYTTDQINAAGRLQFDSNSQCVIDGLDHEEVVFPGVVPAGPFEVRVDTFSLCNQSSARWRAAVYKNPTGTPMLLQEAMGQSLDRDTLGLHGAGSGLLAFTYSP